MKSAPYFSSSLRFSRILFSIQLACPAANPLRSYNTDGLILTPYIATAFELNSESFSDTRRAASLKGKLIGDINKKAALEANRSLPAGRLPILFDSVVADVHSKVNAFGKASVI